MQFAVVDIETTGGYAAGNGITEVAVFVTDGGCIIDTYYALLNPEVPIPRFIEGLTGITNEKVQGQPVFSAIAAELYSVLKDKIFVAHNVNFDYSFLKFHLNKNGYQLDSKKLCTIRLGRRVIPGLKGYGLDKICNHLKIDIEHRHSAAGDARATTELLHLLIGKGGLQTVEQLLKQTNNEMSLPPNLSGESIAKLPQKPGVYFFHDKKGKIIYVGKARNIRKRVKGHFSNNKPAKQKQEFLKKIYHVSFQQTATELMALVLEGVEIKRRWPEQNKSQKHFEQKYGLYTYTDSNGYQRLFIEKRLRHTAPVYSFNNLSEGYAVLRNLVKNYQLCPHLCFLAKVACGSGHCGGACRGGEDAAAYNARLARCISELVESLPSFAVISKGRTAGERSCLLIEEGRFVAMGYVSKSVDNDMRTLKDSLTPYADNAYVRSLILKYAEQHPHETVSFSAISS